LAVAVAQARDVAPGDLLKQIDPHEARHMCGSTLIAAGANPKVIQTVTGHATIKMTFAARATSCLADWRGRCSCGFVPGARERRTVGFVVVALWTQSILLRWRPELRFFEERISILRALEDRGYLRAFHVGETEVGARLIDADHEITVRHDSLSLQIRGQGADSTVMWDAAALALSRISPAAVSSLSATMQHISPLDVDFQVAIDRGYERLFVGLPRGGMKLDDWAWLSNVFIDKPSGNGSVEVGIVQAREIPARLERMIGRARGERGSGKNWGEVDLPKVALFCDSMLICDRPGDLDLEATQRFCRHAEAQVGRLMEDLHKVLSSSTNNNQEVSA